MLVLTWHDSQSCYVSWNHACSSKILALSLLASVAVPFFFFTMSGQTWQDQRKHPTLPQCSLFNLLVFVILFCKCRSGVRDQWPTLKALAVMTNKLCPNVACKSTFVDQTTTSWCGPSLMKHVMHQKSLKLDNKLIFVELSTPWTIVCCWIFECSNSACNRIFWHRCVAVSTKVDKFEYLFSHW